jgi:hypothetical protein
MDWRPIETMPEDYIHSVLLVDIHGNIVGADIESFIDQITLQEFIYYKVMNEDDTPEGRVYRRNNPWTHWFPMHELPLPEFKKPT